MFKNLNLSLREFVLIIICLSLVFISIKSCTDKEKLNSSYQTVLSLKNQQVQQYIDENGRLHSKILVNQSSSAVIDAVYKKQIDSISNILKIKSSSITDFNSDNIESHDNGISTYTSNIKYIHDTINGKVIIDTSIITLNENDGYLKFNANVYKNGKYKWNYDYKDTLTQVIHTQKYGFLNLKTKTLVDISMSNPNSKVTGISEFKINDNDKLGKFSVGPYIGITYDNKIKPSFGIGIQYSLFKF